MKHKIPDDVFCHQMMYKVPGYILNKPDFERVCRIFKKHPHYEAKAGSGIHHVSVQESCRPPAKCFVVHRLDGSVIDISYRKCLGLPASKNGCDIKNMVLV